MAIEGRGLELRQHRYGSIGFEVTAIACSNPECGEVNLTAQLIRLTQSAGHVNQWHNLATTNYKSVILKEFQLHPESFAKPQPAYIPIVLRRDYFEACAIRDKSPKASATLARRCLQGMIRDFCGISKARLIDEIRALRKAVDEGAAPAGVTSETVDAIDSVREVGNIGAHMEKDINVIVDVDPDEAQILIELIELLFEDWYVARNARQQRLARVTALSAAKTAELEAAKLAALPKPETP
jgi:hypothetical protein